MLARTMFFLAQGDHYHSIATTFGIHKSRVSKHIHDVDAKCGSDAMVVILLSQEKIMGMASLFLVGVVSALLRGFSVISTCSLATV